MPTRGTPDKPALPLSGDCAGRLYGDRDTRPESVNVRAGTLDDTSWLVPVANFFMRGPGRWKQRGATALCFDTLSEDYRALTTKWREFWG
jgi:hypothetical protein